MGETSSATRCPACGAANRCAMAADPPAQHCWCMQTGATLAVRDPATDACYCAACLQKLLQNQSTLR